MDNRPIDVRFPASIEVSEGVTTPVLSPSVVIPLLIDVTKGREKDPV